MALTAPSTEVNSLKLPGVVSPSRRLCVRNASVLLAVFALGLSESAAVGRPFEIVIPLAPGGPADLGGRTIAEELTKKWNESVITVSKPGAGMVLAVRYLLEHGGTEGRTMMLGGLGYTTSQFRPTGAPFKAEEIAPVAYLGWIATVLYIRASIPANTVAEFVTWAKNNPQGVSFASSGIGSSPHIAAEEFAASTGIKMSHIPYTGSATFMPAIMGGHVDAVFDSPSSRQHVVSGKIKALMYGSDKLLPSWPELPVGSAVGLPGFKAGSWFGFLVPAKTPLAIQKKLNQDINEVLHLPAVRTRLTQLGFEIAGGTAEDFDKFLLSEHARIKKIIQTRNLVID